jgi:hypothetical protein
MRKTKPVIDLRGDTVSVGDTIAVALTGYNHRPQLRVGTVLEFVTLAEGMQIDVRWSHGSGSGAAMVGEVSHIDATLQRFVLLSTAAE